MKKIFKALLLSVILLFVSAFEFDFSKLVSYDEILSLENSRPVILSYMRYAAKSYKSKSKSSIYLDRGENDIYLIDVFFKLSEVSFEKSQKSEKFIVMIEDNNIVEIDLFYNGNRYHFSEVFLDNTSD